MVVEDTFHVQQLHDLQVSVGDRISLVFEPLRPFNFELLPREEKEALLGQLKGGKCKLIALDLFLTGLNFHGVGKVALVLFLVCGWCCVRLLDRQLDELFN